MRTCTVDGCDRKHVAKGMCGNHYARAHYTSAQRHPKRLMPCTVCGVQVLKTPNGNRYRVVCSEECRYVVAYGRSKDDAARARRAARQLVGPLPRERSCTAPTLVIPGAGRPFISTPCGWCGTHFVHDTRVTGVEVRYCSRRCSRARSKSARKARECGASGTYTLAEVVRIWLLFDKCCAYCQQPTGGLPDPDHVVPLSRGGSNSITNILPACRACNADKSDMTLEEWPADRLRRGLDPRVTTWQSGDVRVRHLVRGLPTRGRWIDLAKAA